MAYGDGYNILQPVFRQNAIALTHFTSVFLLVAADSHAHKVFVSDLGSATHLGVACTERI